MQTEIFSDEQVTDPTIPLLPNNSTIWSRVSNLLPSYNIKWPSFSNLLPSYNIKWPSFSNYWPTNPKQFFIAQGITFFYNISTDITYIVSGLNYPAHLLESTDIPSSISEWIKTINHNITDLDVPWEYGAFAVCIGGTFFLFMSNQRSMPERLYKMFGWQTSPKKQENTETAKWTWKDYYNMSESLASAIWKAFVSGTSLQAWLGPYIGFIASMVIAGAALPGSLFAQLANFIEHSSKNLGALTARLPVVVKKGTALFFTVNYAASATGLFFNQIDKVLLYLKIYNARLLQIESWPISIIVNSSHGVVAVIFFTETCLNYYPSIYNIISKDKRQNSPGTLPTQDLDQSILVNAEQTPIINQNQPSFWKRATKFGMTAAAYKTFSMYCTLLAIIALAQPLNDISWTTFLIVGLAFLTQIPNFISQLTFYSRQERSEASVHNKGVSKLSQIYSCLPKCWKKPEEKELLLQQPPQPTLNNKLAFKCC